MPSPASGGGTTAPFPFRAGAAAAPPAGSGAPTAGPTAVHAGIPRPLTLPPLPSGRPRPAPRRRGPIGTMIGGLFRASQPVNIVAAAIVVILVGNEISVGRAAGRVANTVPSQSLAVLDDRWADYQRLSSRSVGPATWRLESMLKRRTLALTDRVIASYREGLSVVWSAEWTQARQALVRAVAADPGSANLNAALRYVDGHLHRINGDQFRRDKKTDAARREFAAAITAFREAAELRNSWPDPFIGLARTFVSGLGDVDRGADALEQARRLGYTPAEREIAQLADGYADRGDTLRRTARDLQSVPQERDYLNRAAAAYQRALELYAGAATFGGVPASVRRAQVGTRPHAAAAGRAGFARRSRRRWRRSWRRRSSCPARPSRRRRSPTPTRSDAMAVTFTSAAASRRPAQRQRPGGRGRGEPARHLHGARGGAGARARLSGPHAAVAGARRRIGGAGEPGHRHRCGRARRRARARFHRARGSPAGGAAAGRVPGRVAAGRRPPVQRCRHPPRRGAGRHDRRHARTRRVHRARCARPAKLRRGAARPRPSRCPSSPPRELALVKPGSHGPHPGRVPLAGAALDGASTSPGSPRWVWCGG